MPFLLVLFTTPIHPMVFAKHGDMMPWLFGCGSPAALAQTGGVGGAINPYAEPAYQQVGLGAKGDLRAENGGLRG